MFCSICWLTFLMFTELAFLNFPEQPQFVGLDVLVTIVVAASMSASSESFMFTP